MPTLQNLPLSHSAVVVDFNPDAIPLKLIEMGLIAGAEVKLVQVAPLGDPYLFEISGSYVAIRKELAAQIEVAEVNPQSHE